MIGGDTIELSDGRKVRYIGINTPEREQHFYEEAKEANRKMVEGEFVRLEFDVQLPLGERLRVYSGTGTDDEGAVYWGLVEGAVWNNGGDTAHLHDPDGRLVSEYSYDGP